MLAYTLTLSLPVAVGLVCAALSVIGCGILAKRGRSSDLSLAYRLVECAVCVFVISPLLGVLTWQIEDSLIKAKEAKVSAEKEADTKAERKQEQSDKRRVRNKAVRKANQARRNDWAIARQELTETIPDEWTGIIKVLSSDMTAPARVEYVVNALKNEPLYAKRTCPLPLISLNQNSYILNLFKGGTKKRYELSEALVICVDPVITDALDEHLAQKDAGKYDPQKYVELEEPERQSAKPATYIDNALDRYLADELLSLQRQVESTGSSAMRVLLLAQIEDLQNVARGAYVFDDIPKENPMNEQELGIKAIIVLQDSAGIIETTEGATKGWESMGESQRQQTFAAADAVCPEWRDQK